MSGRRKQGFTLLEVVLAVALLSALVVALLPLLVEATRAARRPADEADAGDLARVADRLTQDAGVVTELVALQPGGSRTLRRSEGAGAREITATRIAASGVGGDSAGGRVWLELRSGDARVLRCVTRPAPSAKDTPEAPQTGGGR